MAAGSGSGCFFGVPTGSWGTRCFRSLAGVACFMGSSGVSGAFGRPLTGVATGAARIAAGFGEVEFALPWDLRAASTRSWILDETGCMADAIGNCWPYRLNWRISQASNVRYNSSITASV